MNNYSEKTTIPVLRYLHEIELISRKHNLVLDVEEYGYRFVVHPFDVEKMESLKGALLDTKLVPEDIQTEYDKLKLEHAQLQKELKNLKFRNEILTKESPEAFLARMEANNYYQDKQRPSGK